jgi:Uma2 family endonuclease
MMAVQQQTYTVEEFMDLAQAPEYENKQVELIDGELVIMPPSSSDNSEIALLIGSFIIQFVRANKLGHTTGADGGFRLGPKTVLIPDVGFISASRAVRGAGGVFDNAPDLAVEVISPSESARDVHDKVWAYLRGGTQIVWAVYPTPKVIDVYRYVAEDRVDLQRVGLDGVLDGGDVLPGFSLHVKDIFPEEVSEQN